jgi:hypothetical protein
MNESTSLEIWVLVRQLVKSAGTVHPEVGYAVVSSTPPANVAL